MYLDFQSYHIYEFYPIHPTTPHDLASSCIAGGAWEAAVPCFFPCIAVLYVEHCLSAFSFRRTSVAALVAVATNNQHAKDNLCSIPDPPFFFPK